MRKINIDKIKNKRILALIPARFGSKGIPKKNIIDLGGHPLLAYSIAAAKLSKLINRIIVSTDNIEFAEIAKRYGAEVPFLRPKKYAQDWSADKPYYKHALDWLKKNEGYVPDLVVNLRPTAPARNPKIIDKVILEMIADKKATAVRTAHIGRRTAYKMFRKKGNYANFFGKEDFKKNEESCDRCRQTVPLTYNLNGQVDVLAPKVLRKTGMVHGEYVRAFIVREIIDIDEKKDIKFAEQLLKEKEYLPLLNFLNQIEETRKNRSR